MKTIWFQPLGWFYKPVTWQGVIILVLLLLFWLQVFTAIDRNSHSVSDTLYGIFPYFACSFLLVDWLAKRTCGKR